MILAFLAKGIVPFNNVVLAVVSSVPGVEEGSVSWQFHIQAEIHSGRIGDQCHYGHLSQAWASPRLCQGSKQGAAEEREIEQLLAYWDCLIPLRRRLLCLSIQGEQRFQADFWLIISQGSRSTEKWRPLQGQSVLQFKGLDLTFRCVAVKLPQCYTNPEGICFSKCCLYVAWYAPGHTLFL